MRQGPRRVPQMLATLAILAVAMIAFVAYVGRNAGGNPGTAATPTPSVAVSSAAATCGSLTFGPAMTATAGNAGKHTYAAPPPMSINTAHHFLVTMVTNKGTITLCLDPSLAPNTVNNFVFLTRNQFYDGLKFHRVVAAFVIQGGDPLGTGSGGPGYKFNDEPVLGAYTAGALAMANSGANTNGSQFFICTVDDTTKLAKSYNLFGYVQSGMDVVLKIAQGDVMTSVTVQEQSS
jgi:cyclophilin family peptidyl-prolyl cis-trans isomerase